MKEISFYDYGLEDIFCGRKSSTLRYDETGFSAGEIVKLVRQNGQFVGFLKISSVKSVKFSELTETDAFIENWNSLQDLKARLKFSYCSLTPDESLIRISFCYLKKIPEVKRQNCSTLVTQPGEISIVTESQEKFERFSYIFLKYFNLRTSIQKPKTIESFFEDSSEQRAKEKLKLAEGKIVFATDDMALITLKNEVVQVPNMKDLKRYISQIEQMEFEITIRTGLAFRNNEAIVTHPVLRTFKAKKAEYNSLNEILSLGNMPVSSLGQNNEILIKPIVDGIKVLLKGGL